MRYLYNLIQLSATLLFLPLIVPFVALTPRYRWRVLRRLGWGLGGQPASLTSGRPRIWVHGLSVGEIASARSLIEGLKDEYPEGDLILSATTRSGENYAVESLDGLVDILIPFPLDYYWVVARFVKLISPDLFILIETDLWPNLLTALKRDGAALMLVNGRISESSFRRFNRFKPFWRGFLRLFDLIAMQTAEGAARMVRLGVAPERLSALGNLKYGTLLDGSSNGDGFAPAQELAAFADGSPLIVAGSLHAGEYEPLLETFSLLKKKFTALKMILAPRNIDRAPEIVKIARGYGCLPHRRTAGVPAGYDLVILDTLGELGSVYSLADLVFIGGSLVALGGHNPLEAAVFGKPVVFGPHMEDFSEIAEDLAGGGGAVQVSGRVELETVFELWLSDEQIRIEVGEKAAALVAEKRGVTRRHLEAVRMILGPERMGS